MKRIVTLVLLSSLGCKKDARPAEAPLAQSAAPPTEPAARGSTETTPISTAKKVDIAEGQTLVEITIDESGYNPPVVEVEKGEPTHFRFRRVFEKTCADGIVVPTASINQPIGVGDTVEFALVVDADTVYGCPMGLMINGTIKVKE